MSAALPLLYGLTDPRGARGLTPLEAASLLLSAGVRLVQVRDKEPSGRRRFVSAREVVEAVARAGGVAIVNDRPDVALLSGAAGVHVGEEDLPASAARRVLPGAAVVGVSTHSVPAALAAMEDPAVTYVALGPLFPTRTKESPYTPLGIGAVEEVARRKTKPLVVIGGISPEDVGACLLRGADSVAMIAGLLDGDPARNVELALESARRAGFARPA